MGKCKNVECVNMTTGKRVYCSLSCRSSYTNKYLKDYTKNKEYGKKQRVLNEEKYYKNPKTCPNCDNIITYMKRSNTFCNSSCMATFTNKGRVVTWGEKIGEGVKRNLIENGKHVGLHKLMCVDCDSVFEHKRPKTMFCSAECQLNHGRRDMVEFKKYKLDTEFKFNLGDYPDEFNFELVREYGWYSPRNKSDNLGGVSRDHMLSVVEGFELDIDPFLLAHPANCELMVHTDNISKNRNSSITIVELMERIEKFE